jgi:hypothetical protein
VFKVTKKHGRERNSFSNDKCTTRWVWWLSFKETYGFHMRLPENE